MNKLMKTILILAFLTASLWLMADKSASILRGELHEHICLPNQAIGCW